HGMWQEPPPVQTLLRVALEETLHVLPRVRGRVLELLELPIEEAVRRAGIDVLLVLDARLLQRLRERFPIAFGNAFVRTTIDGENGRLELRGGVDRPRPIRPALETERPPIEPDHAGIAEAAG